MTKTLVCLAVVSLCFLCLPGRVNAQVLPPPPPCCAPQGFLPEAGVPVAKGYAAAQFIVPDEMIRLQGVSRAQFVGRIADALFPGRPVQFIVAVRDGRSTLTLPGARLREGDEAAYGAEFGLIAIEERYVYRIPGPRITEEQLGQAEELVVTDGEVSMKLHFIASGARPGSAGLWRPLPAQ